MHSSTSSSERGRTQGDGWAGLWATALVLSLAALLVAETILRASGFGPIVRDDPSTWAVARRRVEPQSVIFVGTSRAQADIDPSTFASAWGGIRPVQLAIAGGSPLPIVEDLARDPTFRGTLIIDVVPRLLFSADPEPVDVARRMLLEHEAAAVSPARRSEARLRMLLSGSLAIRSLPLRQLLDRLMLDPPRIPYYSMDAARFLQLDFQKGDLERRKRTLAEQVATHHAPAGDVERDAVIDRLLEAERAILFRGGSVFLVQMPRGGRVREIEEERFPRARFWDVLVRRSRGRVIDSAEEASLADFECPDGSHLDVRDARAFTSALAALMVERLHECDESRRVHPQRA